MLVTSIDPLAAYKISDDLILELMSVTASVEDDSEGASVGTWWVQIVEPHELVKHQRHGGYMLDNRQVHLNIPYHGRRSYRRNCGGRARDKHRQKP